MGGAIVCLIVLIPFFIFASVLSKGKGAFLLSGYNSMPAGTKSEIDEAALCKFIGKIMYGICLSLLLLAISEMMGHQVLLFIGLFLFLSFIVFALVYTNTGNRFKKQP
ncbi:DUF3784 domain-containing protein [Mesobacillus foraminis]|uniref:DUF3784 domain-containing protein n=1 Tax=Mesobacillus foraminis TaxID=279826 RepID=UPI001BEA5EE7|nr:DUF3784 domain-containing protein [Mesobacillus foraminis]MBT2757705.1 DUF3784 domain-containing protein [Mesobacillus foraminis]